MVDRAPFYLIFNWGLLVLELCDLQLMLGFKGSLRQYLLFCKYLTTRREFFSKQMPTNMPLRYDKPRKIIKESEQFPSREKMNQEDLNNQVLQCTGLCGIEGWNSLCHLRGNHQWKEHGDKRWLNVRRVSSIDSHVYKVPAEERVL